MTNDHSMTIDHSFENRIISYVIQACDPRYMVLGMLLTVAKVLFSHLEFLVVSTS